MCVWGGGNNAVFLHVCFCCRSVVFNFFSFLGSDNKRGQKEEILHRSAAARPAGGFSVFFIPVSLGFGAFYAFLLRDFV